MAIVIFFTKTYYQQSDKVKFDKETEQCIIPAVTSLHNKLSITE